MSVAKATGASALKSQYQGVQTNYSSNEVGIPEDFLKEQAHDCQPVRVSRIDFSNTVVPEYAGYYAIILDNVLSPSECQGLLKLAEESAIPDADGRLWRPAMVNIGGNYEMMATDYRNSDRIIWDSQEMINRIWERCLSGEGVQDDLARIDRNPFVQGERAANRGARWRFTRPNERMRFLRYTKGQYFDKHCDGSYENPNHWTERSHYTFHLYLSGDKSLDGGSTTFFSRDGMRTLDVEPNLGRVLIFQHRGLIHSGQEVAEGEKFTMRTDLMYEIIPKEDSDHT